VLTQNMDGWYGVSGVPGLGCSVSTHHRHSSLHRLWEEGAEDKRTKNQSFTGKIAKFFKSKSTKPAELITSDSAMHCSESVSKMPVKRSLSAATASQRKKVLPSSDNENVNIITCKSNIKRSVSLFKEKDCQVKKGNRIIFSKKSDSEIFSKQTLSKSESPHQLKNEVCLSTFTTITKDLHTSKSQATQTDIITSKPDEDYDYVYSNWISPAMLIKLAEQLKVDDEDDNTDNVYEEIIPKERKVGRSNSLFNQGRKEKLSVNRMTEWKMEDGKFNDNYIKPQAIKQVFATEIQKQKNKASKNVTFRVGERKLRRSKSVSTNSQSVLSPELHSEQMITF